MNENDRGPRPEAAEADEVGELIRSAGRRPAIPDDDLVAINDAARSAWRRMAAAERRKRLRLRSACALAASVLIAIAGAWWLWPGGAPALPEQIATVELTTGRVELFRAADTETIETIAVGDSLSAGAVLETAGIDDAAPGRLTLRLLRRQSVRLDDGTRLRIVSHSRLELERGAVYVDSDRSAPAGEGLEILTPLGLVRETGTQYEVRLDGEAGAVRLRVREGGISVERDGEAHAAARGEELTLRSDGSVVRGAVEPAGPDWLWVLETAPSIDIEGRSLAAFLDWAARETGREVRYADEELARSAGTIQLHGTIEGLRPDESITVILQGSGLESWAENGSVLVFRP